MRTARTLLTAALCLTAASLCSAQPAKEYKLGPWSLDMTRAQVIAQAAYGPYVPVAVTGGLEMFDAMIDGKKENVSFVFDHDSVKFIQMFKYEGSDFSAARKAALDVFRLFDSRFDGATVSGVAVDGRSKLDIDSFIAFIDRTLGTAVELGEKEKKDHAVAMLIRFDMKPLVQPANCQLHAQLIYTSRSKTFYVLVFQDKPGAPDRTATSVIEVTPL
jgi:hypothetical protein